MWLLAFALKGDFLLLAGFGTPWPSVPLLLFFLTCPAAVFVLIAAWLFRLIAFGLFLSPPSRLLFGFTLLLLLSPPSL